MQSLSYLCPDRYLLIYRTNIKYFRYASQNKDAWAVITGSAMGIGRQYGISLAKMGFNIVMIDKDEKEMERSKHDIASFGVKVQNIKI